MATVERAPAGERERELDRLRFALAATGVGVWTWDPAADVGWWSDDVAPLFGLPRGASPPRYAGLLELIDAADRDDFAGTIARALATRSEFAVEFRAARPDGEVRWLLARGRVETNEAGEPDYLHGIVADITGRKRADETLRLNEERYRALVSASADVVWTMTGEGGHQVEERLVGLEDRTWSAFTGQSERQLRDETWLAAVHPDDRARAEQAWRDALATGEGYEAEYRLRRRDGVYRVVADRGVPLRDGAGRIVQWIGACVDVTEARAAEAERSREEERQRFLATVSATLAAALDDGTAVQELARLIVQALADACVVNVLEPGGVIRPRVTAAGPETQAVLDELQARYPATLDRPRGLARVLTTGRSWYVPVVDEKRRAELAVDDEHRRLLRALGTRSTVTVAMVARGEILGALTLMRIRSDVPYGPADLAFAEELARRAALALDNARLLREARAAVRLRDEFLSSASHDLRNPLTTIRGRVQLLRRRAERGRPLEPEAVAHGLEEIAAAAAKLDAMIEELQDVSSLQIGRPLTLHHRRTDLIALAREELEQVQRTTQRHRLRLVTDLATLEADVDPARLRRVLDNLLSNAVKYSPDGGEITVALGREGPDADGAEWATLTVRDRGVGIPAADLPRLFERFYRGSNVAGRIVGTGIGLAGARQIVAQHGGTIAVDSEEGRGSAFTVRLPLAAGGTEPDGSSPDTRPTAAPSSTGVTT